jgi:hypothetical protein
MSEPLEPMATPVDQKRLAEQLLAQAARSPLRGFGKRSTTTSARLLRGGRQPRLGEHVPPTNPG